MTEKIEILSQCITQQLNHEKIGSKPLETIEQTLVSHESIINGQSLSQTSEVRKMDRTQASKEAIFGQVAPTTDNTHNECKPTVTVQTQKAARMANSGLPPKRRKTVQGPRPRKEEKESSEDDEQQCTTPKPVKLSTEKINKKRQALKRCSSTKQHNFEKYRPPALDIKNLKEEIIQRIPSEDYGGHIFQPSKKMLEKQKDLNETILDLNQCKTRTFFLYHSIPLGTRLTFEVIIEKDSIFSREYSFWLGGQQGKLLLMHCKKNLKILEDYYIISEYIETLNCYNFMAKLQSSTLRKQFILSNQIEHIVDPYKQIFADINVCGDPINNRESAVVVYFPAFDKYSGVQTIIRNAPDKDVLKQLAKEGNHVSFLTPCSLQKKMQKQFMFENGLLHSKRSVTLMDQQGWPKLFTSKLQSKKYRIYAGSGVSPLIIFSTFIVLYES